MRSDFSLNRLAPIGVLCDGTTIVVYVLPSGNPFKCHKAVLSLQPMVPPN